MYMIQSQAVREAIGSDCRTFRVLLEFDNFDISGSDVGRCTIEHTMSDDNTLTIGEVISKRAEIDLFSRRSVRKGDVFRLYLYLLDYDGERTERATHRSLSQWTHRELSMFTHQQIAYLGRTKDPDGVPLDGYYIPMGEFVVTKVTLSGTAATIVAYDRLAFADKAYVPTITFPADAGAVADDVLAQLGITSREIVSGGYLLTSDQGEVLTSDAGELLCSAEYSFTINDAPEGMTCREVLGAIAAMYGGNAVLDRNGACTTAFIRSIGADYSIERMDEPELAAEDISVSGIRCILSGDDVLTAGNPDGPYAVEFTCPYMTQERLAAIWKLVRNIKWRPAQIYERLADPRRDIGDMRNLAYRSQRMNIPIMSLIYHFDGGLSADITACGQTENEDIVLEEA